MNDISNKKISITVVVCQIWPDMWSTFGSNEHIDFTEKGMIRRHNKYTMGAYNIFSLLFAQKSKQ